MKVTKKCVPCHIGKIVNLLGIQWKNVSFVVSGPLTPEDLGQYVVSDMNIKEYHCALCENFKAKLPSKVRNHLEAIHFPGLFLYSCDICDKTMKGRNALNIHKSTMHSKKIKNFITHSMNV